MNFQNDNKTAILKDTSIVVFEENGQVNLYPSTKWIKPRNKNKYGFGHCHVFHFKSKDQAIQVFTKLESEI